MQGKRALEEWTVEWTVEPIVSELRRFGSKKNVEGMARFGIRGKNIYGVTKPKLEELARKIGPSHALALQLWETGIHDARILAGMVDQPEMVSPRQMDRWVRDFDSWDICDGSCCHLFVFAKPAWSKALSWTRRKKEFEKRAGFALAAYLAIHDKTAPSERYRELLSAIEREAWDGRNFVKKAVNWALRNIGKRNRELNQEAIACAESISKSDSPAARWISADALRELRSKTVQDRLLRKET
jgi:3-methyladenine DNA glycosylase AlkD